MNSTNGLVTGVTAPSRRQLLRLMGGLTLTATVPGVLTACSNNASGGALSLIGVADEEAPLEALTKKYAAARDQVTFRTSYAPTDQVMTSVRAQLAGGNAPDLHVLYPGSGSAMCMAQLAEVGLLADLSDQSWVSVIPPNFAATFNYDDKTHLFSAGLTVIGTIYNKKTFSEVGVDIPTTWSELLDVCNKIKAAGKIPIALGAQTQWVTQLITYALVASTVYADTPDFDDLQIAGEASFEDSGWREAMERYLELRDRGFFNDNPNGTTLEQQTSLVGTGQAAMAVQVAPLLPAFRDAASNADDISMFPFPSADSADKLWTWGAPNVGIGVHAKSKNLDAALDFVEFLGRQENMNRWCELASAIPLKRDAQSKVDPALEPFLPLLDANKAAPIGVRWPNAEVQPVHLAGIQELLADKTTVVALLKKMDETYNKDA